jgi:hypothetical protein
MRVWWKVELHKLAALVGELQRHLERARREFDWLRRISDRPHELPPKLA